MGSALLRSPDPLQRSAKGGTLGELYVLVKELLELNCMNKCRCMFVWAYLCVCVCMCTVGCG